MLLSTTVLWVRFEKCCSREKFSNQPSLHTPSPTISSHPPTNLLLLPAELHALLFTHLPTAVLSHASRTSLTLRAEAKDHLYRDITVTTTRPPSRARPRHIELHAAARSAVHASEDRGDQRASRRPAAPARGVRHPQPHCRSVLRALCVMHVYDGPWDTPLAEHPGVRTFWRVMVALRMELLGCFARLHAVHYLVVRDAALEQLLRPVSPLGGQGHLALRGWGSPLIPPGRHLHGDGTITSSAPLWQALQTLNLTIHPTQLCTLSYILAHALALHTLALTPTVNTSYPLALHFVARTNHRHKYALWTINPTILALPLLPAKPTLGHQQVVRHSFR
ncbi:hypothetical protein DFH27DRAFT_645182 [Peziza echinospora]|nr:hypothetical protein DFH27DRAFT_645182 [Peziza echinospora]